jgi:cell division protein FtsX
LKLGSVKYLIGEGIKNTWVNRLMTLASVGVLVACMVVIGLALLISENVSKAIGNLEQQNVVMVYMKDYNWALYSEKTEEAETESSETAETTETTEDGAEAPAEEADVNGIKPSDYIIHNDEEAKALCDKIAENHQRRSAHGLY